MGDWELAIGVGLLVFIVLCMVTVIIQPKKTSTPEVNYLLSEPEPEPEPEPEKAEPPQETVPILVQCQYELCPNTWAPRAGPEWSGAGQRWTARMDYKSFARSIGWAWWEGVTQGGTRMEVIYCPYHNPHRPVNDNTEDDEEEPKVEAWDAECDTCGDVASSDISFRRREKIETGEELTEEQANKWSRLHECEPDVSVYEV